MVFRAADIHHNSDLWSNPGKMECTVAKYQRCEQEREARGAVPIPPTQKGLVSDTTHLLFPHATVTTFRQRSRSHSSNSIAGEQAKAFSSHALRIQLAPAAHKEQRQTLR